MFVCIISPFWSRPYHKPPCRNMHKSNTSKKLIKPNIFVYKNKHTRTRKNPPSHTHTRTHTDKYMQYRYSKKKRKGNRQTLTHKKGKKTERKTEKNIPIKNKKKIEKISAR